MSDFLYSALKTALFMAVGLALCWLGRQVRLRVPQWRKAVRGVTAGDNPAQALSSGAYYLAALLCLGGPLSWASDSLGRGLVEAAAFGAMALVLLNASLLAAERTYLSGWRLGEGVARGSLEAGLAEAAHSLALGLVIMGASWGEAGGPGVMLYFWALGQLFLWLALAAYTRLFKLDALAHIAAGSLPAALSLAGAVIAFGNVVRAAISGPYLGFARSTLESAAYFGLGFGALLGGRWLADLLLFPDATFHGEIFRAEKPNLPAAVLDALLFIGLSALFGWSV